MDTIDGYGKNASPCPSEPLWLQGTLILDKPRDLVIPDCQCRTPWTGGNHRLRRTAKVDDCKLSPRFHTILKKPGYTGTGECCLKRWAKKELNFFWYSCQYLKFDRSIDMIWRSKPGHFLIAKEYKARATCNLLGSLKK